MTDVCCLYCSGSHAEAACPDAAVNLRHTFVQDDAETPGICYCGDVDFVHKPQTLHRLLKRAWCWLFPADTPLGVALVIVGCLAFGGILSAIIWSFRP